MAGAGVGGAARRSVGGGLIVHNGINQAIGYDSFNEVPREPFGACAARGRVFSEPDQGIAGERDLAKLLLVMLVAQCNDIAADFLRTTHDKAPLMAQAAIAARAP
jgi:hypothetical protein